MSSRSTEPNAPRRTRRRVRSARGIRARTWGFIGLAAVIVGLILVVFFGTGRDRHFSSLQAAAYERLVEAGVPKDIASGAICEKGGGDEDGLTRGQVALVDEVSRGFAARMRAANSRLIYGVIGGLLLMFVGVVTAIIGFVVAGIRSRGRKREIKQNMPS